MTKQVIVVRKDLKMPPGKVASQVAHAASAFLQQCFKRGYALTDLPEPMQHWLNGPPSRVILTCPDGDTFVGLRQSCLDAGIEHVVICDAGRTFFDQPTDTTLAIGPWWSEDIDAITGGLKLL